MRRLVNKHRRFERSQSKNFDCLPLKNEETTILRNVRNYTPVCAALNIQYFILKTNFSLKIDFYFEFRV